MALTQKSRERTRAWPTIAAVLAMLAALLVSPLALAPRAEAYIYWTESGRNAAIGRANLDGTGVDRGFLDQHAGVITADAGHLYWSDRNDDVSRSNIDGTSVDPSFIDGLVPVICSRGCVFHVRPGGRWSPCLRDGEGRFLTRGAGGHRARQPRWHRGRSEIYHHER